MPREVDIDLFVKIVFNHFFFFFVISLFIVRIHCYSIFFRVKYNNYVFYVDVLKYFSPAKVDPEHALESREIHKKKKKVKTHRHLLSDFYFL